MFLIEINGVLKTLVVNWTFFFVPRNINLFGIFRRIFAQFVQRVLNKGNNRCLVSEAT